MGIVEDGPAINSNPSKYNQSYTKLDNDLDNINGWMDYIID